ncbi:MAG: sugar ABC transporter substrate-binding protein [Chloroflexi bacterium]|nr:sugar ABC transporter substrate-binding protein [Chloroflexota bacterium]
MRTFTKSLIPVVAAMAMAMPAVAQSPAAPVVNPGDAIGISLISTTDTNTVNAMTAFKELATTDGWTINEVDALGEANGANSAIESFVNQGVKGIISTIFPADALQAGITAANTAGIPVVGHFSGDGPGLAAFSSSGGDAQMTQAMADAMGGTGEVLALTYRPGKPCLERELILDAVLAANPGITVTKQEMTIPDYVEPTAEAARGWAQSRPAGGAPLAIWGCWEGFTLAAITALKELERNDVKTYGYNGDADAQQAIRDGWLTATTWFDNVAVGKDEYAVLMDAIAAGADWTPVEVPATTVVVNAETIDAWLVEHPEAIPPVAQ